MKVGDIIKLKGKNSHGKNRVREQGEFWKVASIATALPHGPFPSGTPVIRLITLDGKRWRTIAHSDDENFEILNEDG